MLYRLYGPQRMNTIDYSHHITYHLAPLAVKVFSYPVKCHLLDGFVQMTGNVLAFLHLAMR